MDTKKFRLIALPATLALALLAAPAAFAQDTTTDNEAETTATVPAGRIADRYADTLFDGDEDAAADAVKQLRGHLRTGTVTLLYAARDEEHNNAVALKQWLGRRRSK